MLSPSLDLLDSLVKKQMPFFVVRVSADKPIAIFKYKSNVQDTKNVENCKSKLRINNKIEKSHEPMTYSMRYFAKGYPDNYKEEQRYIDKYVRNINAPIKYSEMTSSSCQPMSNDTNVPT